MSSTMPGTCRWWLLSQWLDKYISECIKSHDLWLMLDVRAWSRCRVAVVGRLSGWWEEVTNGDPGLAIRVALLGVGCAHHRAGLWTYCFCWKRLPLWEGSWLPRSRGIEQGQVQEWPPCVRVLEDRRSGNVEQGLESSNSAGSDVT